MSFAPATVSNNFLSEKDLFRQVASTLTKRHFASGAEKENKEMSKDHFMKTIKNI